MSSVLNTTKNNNSSDSGEMRSYGTQYSGTVYGDDDNDNNNSNNNSNNNNNSNDAKPFDAQPKTTSHVEQSYDPTRRDASDATDRAFTSASYETRNSNAEGGGLARDDESTAYFNVVGTGAGYATTESNTAGPGLTSTGKAAAAGSGGSSSSSNRDDQDFISARDDNHRSWGANTPSGGGHDDDDDDSTMNKMMHKADEVLGSDKPERKGQEKRDQAGGYGGYGGYDSYYGNNQDQDDY